MLNAVRPSRPLARVTSTNVPLPVLRNSRFWPTQVTRDVGKAVVVEVADGDAHAVELDVEAGGARDVGERAVAVVAVEAQRRSLPLVPGPVHAVDEQDVLPAVAVVVEERAARAERLGQELAAVRAAVVAEGEAGRGGDVDEPEARAVAAGCGPRGVERRTVDARASRAAARRNSRRFTAG